MGLHSLDYYLTLYGARLYRAGASRVYNVSGNYELNPFFQQAIDSESWFSRRFLTSLVLVGAYFFVLASGVGWLADGAATRVDADTEGAQQVLREVYSALMGAYIFTRVAVIGFHLQNNWLFRRINRPHSPIRGSFTFDRQTVYRLAAHRFAGFAMILGVAACLAPSGWLLGGFLGCALVAGNIAVLGSLPLARPGCPAEQTVTLPLSYGPSFDLCVGAGQGLRGVKHLAADSRAGTIEVRTGWSWKSWGERISFGIREVNDAETGVTVSSRCVLSTTLVDYGKNASNVRRNMQLLAGPGRRPEGESAARRDMPPA